MKTNRGFVPVIIGVIVLVALVAGGIIYSTAKKPVTTIPPEGQLVGNDRDSHGCIGSAGYSWCEVKQKCLRVWEEKCEATATSTIPSNWKTYRNDKYRFEFRYPSNYTLANENTWQLDLLSPDGQHLLIDIDNTGFPEMTFLANAVQNPKAHCAVDGHGYSESCPGVSKQNSITTQSGIDGYEIYFNHVLEKFNEVSGQYDQVSADIKGPIFALNFTPLENHEITAIFVNKKGSFSNHTIMSQIVSTFKFTK